MPSRTIASLALACASLADAFAPAPSTRLAPLRHAPRRSLVARSSSSDVFGGASTLAVAGTGSSDDPFLIGIAGDVLYGERTKQEWTYLQEDIDKDDKLLKIKDVSDSDSSESLSSNLYGNRPRLFDADLLSSV